MEPSTVDNADLLDRLRSLPAAALPLKALEGEPGAWVVGGVVRDLLLGVEPAGILDVVVEGDAVAVARRAAERVGGRVVVHERFGTATVTVDGGGFDIAASRRESYARPGALPDVEVGAPLREDLARRDFTVNAIALDLRSGALCAFPGALEDLSAGLLRVLHPASFIDDPTRLLRLARYSARLGFAAEPRTAQLAEEAVPGVHTVSASRLGAELRLLLKEPLPAALLALDGLGREVVHPTFAARSEVIGRALALCPGGLVALAACLRPAADLAARLDALEFTAGERGVVVDAVTRARPLAAELARGPDDVALWLRARAERPETVALAGALDPAAEPAARRWLDDVRHRGLEITGDDLVAAGITGPPVGRGLEAAMAAALAGTAPDRETQLATAIEAAGPK
jgi:tRNA nucleotidyltransferase (CCA-adding enzyme)